MKLIIVYCESLWKNIIEKIPLEYGQTFHVTGNAVVRIIIMKY